METPETPRTTLLLFLTAALAGCDTRADSRPEAPPGDAPRLMVMVDVDQLRADLLERYEGLWEGGFARILSQGRVHTQAVHDHAITQTAPGHATLATGVFPSRHGVVANAFWELPDGEPTRVYSLGDPESPILGAPDAEGRSPRNLLRPGLADWTTAADPSARILSLSTKDRTAIALAGRTQGHVYWFLDTQTRFVTSAWYRSEYPEWVEAFNWNELPALLDSTWTSIVPEAARGLTRPDTAEYEAPGGRSYFPRRFVDESEETGVAEFGDWVKETTPFLDGAVLALARIGIRELEMGADSVPDLLALGLSQTDYVGHRFGPLSREQLDNLLRLDRALGEFFQFLDREVGRERWVLAFTADHGVAITPEYSEGAGHRLTREERASLREATRDAWSGAPDRAEGARRVAEALERFPFVEAAYTEAELEAPGEPADSFLRLYRNSYHPGRTPDDWGRYGVVLRFTPGTIRTTGDATTHGSPYMYDRRVPMAFLGPGVEPGWSDAPVRTVDVAPTLAALAGVPFPGDLDGTTLGTPETGPSGGR